MGKGWSAMTKKFQRIARVAALFVLGATLVACSKPPSETIAKRSERLVITNGLVAAYDFDEGSGTTATDASGSGNTGSLSGPTWVAQGRRGSALSFDGTNDRVIVPDSNSLDVTSGVTMMAWVKPASLDTVWGNVIFKQRGTVGFAYALYSSGDEGDTHAGSPSAWVRTGSSDKGVSAGHALRTDRWTHIAATYQASSFRFYVNGKLDVTATVSGTIPTTTQALSIGGNAIWGDWFDGLIDEVRVYNRRLSASEVALEMGGLSPGPAPTLVAAYAFDEGMGSSAADASGSANVGTLSGPTWTAAGKHGGALSFDGVNDRVTIADSPSLDLTYGMTLMAWVNPTAIDSDWRTVIHKEDQAWELDYGLFAADGAEQPPAGYLNHDGVVFATTGQSALPLDTWSHLALTYNDVTQDLFVNGTLVATRNQNGDLLSSTDPLSVGGNGIWGQWFEGLIDDVRVYDNGLTQAQIATDMNTPVGSGTGCGTGCDDGNACNGAETCVNGSCVAGTPVTCTAEDQCHDVGTCSPATGVCSNPPKANGTACNDTNACTQTDTCQSGTCTGANPVVCTASDSCHDVGTCNPASGVCSNPAKPNGTACSDSTVCNGSETCQSGSCTPGTPPETNDGNPCTADACHPVTGVSHTPVAAGTLCLDANACNGIEACNATGTCQAGTPPTIDDGNPCTVDACDQSTGVSHIPAAAGTSCSDSDLCNGGELCDAAGVCQSGTPVPTEDGNECTTGSCNPLTGVVTQTPLPTGTECFLDICTLAECNATGECSAAGSTVIDDGDPCTVEWCDPVLGPQVKTCSTLDRTVGTTLHESMKWIYEGTNPPQVGVAPGTIEVKRAAALRGVVKTRDGSVLPGVKVTVLNHPEFGHTLTHVDGYFDMVVNGGGTLVVAFEREGYLGLHRSVGTQWGEHASVPEVMMTPPDPVVTPIDLLSLEGDFQVAQASIATDADGTRQGTLLVPSGTEATMHLADGSTIELTSMNVRITEFTVGEQGLAAMPGDLPAESKYTYAFEVNADEAVATGAESITFSQPLIYYVDNFLQLPSGTPVPLGSFDREAGAWKASDSGVSFEIVGESSGLSELDVTGDHLPDPPSILTSYGITDAERTRLAGLYEPGRTLWRFLIPHFTQPWDANMGGGPPEDATGPTGDPPIGDPQPPCTGGGVAAASTIECQSQKLRESIPIAGTPYTLNYSNDRVPDYQAAYVLKVPLSKEVPESLLRIKLKISIAGQNYKEEFPPLPNQTATYTWNGLDKFDRLVQGTQTAQIEVSYVYRYVYTRTDRFGYNGNGLAITIEQVPVPPGEFPSLCGGVLGQLAAFSSGTGVLAGAGAGGCAEPRALGVRTEISIAQHFTVPVGTFEAREIGLGGWTLDPLHVHELASRRLQLGDGTSLNEAVLPNVVRRVATLPPGAAARLVVAPDGTIYTGGGGRVFRTSAGGEATIFAGDQNDNRGYGGDGLPATDPAVRLSAVQDLALGADGTLYIADFGQYFDPDFTLHESNLVRRVRPDGVIETAAGVPGVRGFSVNDGDLATATPLADPRHVAVAPDGTLFVSTQRSILRIDPDGRMNRVAGLPDLASACMGLPPDGSVARDVHLTPWAIALAPDGTLYATVASCDGCVCGLNRIVRFVDGKLFHVAGNGCAMATGCPTQDGLFATEASIGPLSLAFDGRGILQFTDLGRVRVVTADRYVDTVASVMQGSPAHPFMDGLPATAVNLAAADVSAGPDGLYVAGSLGNSDVFRVAAQLPTDGGTSFVIGARDGESFYDFDLTGRVLSTRHALTGSELHRFEYSGGRLHSMTNEAGLVTTIERDAGGNPTAIVAPFGQRTELELDPNGYLNGVRDPAGNLTTITYSSGGLLTSFTNARNFTSTMQYDALGRLHIDEDAADGSHTLTRVDDASGRESTVVRATALGRTTTYTTSIPTSGPSESTILMPEGTESRALIGDDRILQTFAPDGTVIRTSETPDNRFGLSSPLLSRTVTTPSGLTSLETTSRAYSDLNPFNLLDFFERRDVTTRNGRNWTTSFIREERSFTTTSPQGRQTLRFIDPQGRTTRTQVGNLLPVDSFYDTQGRLDHVTQGTRTTQNAYFPTGDAAGYLQTITDATGVPTTFTRDTLGRTLTETRAAATTSFSWDPLSNLATVTPPGKPIHEMTYTPVSLLESYEPPPAGLPVSATGYTYDLDRMLRTETRPNAVTITRTPDSAGRLDTVAFPGGLIDYDYFPSSAPSGAGKVSNIAGPYGVDLSFAYDGSLTTSTSWSGDVSGSVSWQYNNDFQKILETVSGAAGTASTVFGYDLDQLLTCASPTTCSPPGADALTLTRSPQHGMVTNISLGQTSEVWTYNAYGELARQTASFNGSPLVDITYDAPGFERDQLGRIVRKMETILGVTKVYEYRYDALRRLDQVKIDGVVDEEFTYDGNGNRLTYFKQGVGTVSATYDDQDRLLTYGTWTFTYTANGEMETKTNTSTSETWLFQYDAMGNLVSVGLPNGDLVEYLVDGIGRRVGKKKNGVLLKQWIYRDTLKPVAELDGAGNLATQFVYGSWPHVPDYVVRDGATYRIIVDHLGSPRYAVDAANPSNVPLTANYGAFGGMAGTGLSWMPFGMAAGQYDPDTGLVRFGVRDLDPLVGRWTSKDPLVFRSDSANLYVYAGNDPVNAADFTGRVIWIISSIMCMYYEYEAADAFDKCRNDYGKACGDMTSQSCSDYCGGGQPSYPSDDIRKCVERTNPGAFSGMLKWCTRFAAGYMGSGTGASPSGPLGK